ncbi:MAG: ATP-binding protein [Acidobacteria bacterium]|nr:ATP-binding protein [Acidobacteriota bacterium]
MPMIKTLRAKFLLSFILIGLANIVLSLLMILGVVHATNSRMARKNFVRWAQDFEAMAEPNFIYFNYMNLSAQTEDILRGNPLDFIMLSDAQGKEIFFKGPEGLKDGLTPERIPLGGEPVAASFAGRPYLLLKLPVKVATADTQWGSILFGHSSEENRAILAQLRLNVLLISAVLLAAFSALIVLINRKLTEPIQLLKNGLEKVSFGDFSHRIQIHSNDEFFFLGGQFNEMAEKIESMMTEIEATQRSLEKQVTARTRELNDSNQKLQVAMQELRDTQQHIIQSEKQKSLTAIVSGFAHEINNPLTGILGYVDLIAIRDDASPYVREKLGSIQKQAVRIKNIIDQLNQLNPDMDQVKMDISLANLLEKLVKVIAGRPENAEYAIVRNLAGEDMIILGNHFALWQVFEGIVENAIEALRENAIAQGRVEIDLKRSMDGAQAIVDIRDNGGGFKNLDKAFDPFYTTKNRTQKKGIGLTIAYNIIQEHQGNIVIKNNDGGGATVSVYLKIADRKSNMPTRTEDK